MKDPKITTELSQIQKHKDHLQIDNELHIFCTIIESTYQIRVYGEVKSMGGPQTRLITQVETKSKFEYKSKAKRELAACVYGTRVATSIATIPGIEIGTVNFWTNSLNAFYWIKHQTSRTESDVRLRVYEILRTTRPQQWSYYSIENESIIPIFNA